MRTYSTRILSRYLPLLLCAALGCTIALADGPKMFGSIPEVHIINGNGMIALQPTVDFLIDATWSVDKAAGTATVTFPKDYKVIYTLDKTVANVNGRDIRIAVAPFEHLGIFYVPSEPLTKACGGTATVDMTKNLVNMSFDGPNGLYSIYLPFDPAEIAKKVTSANYSDSDTELYVVAADGTGQRRLSYNTHADSLPVFPPNQTADSFRIIYERNGKLYIRTVTDRYEAPLAKVDTPAAPGAPGVPAVPGGNPVPPPVPPPMPPGVGPPGAPGEAAGPRPLTAGGQFYPECVSPDGNTLIFTQRFNAIRPGMPAGRPGGMPPGLPGMMGQQNIVSCALTGTDTPKVLVSGADSPCFSPDGKYLAYTSRTMGRASIAVIDLKNPMQPRAIGDGEKPIFGSDGKTILFTRTYAADAGKSYSMLVTYVSRGGGQPGIVTEPKPGERTGNEIAGGFSPDGKKIVYSCSTGISVMKPDRTNVKQLTTNEKDRCPQYTPDGSQILFLRGNDLYVMYTDGSNARQLTKGAAVLDYRMAPGGKQIFFLSCPEEPKAPAAPAGPPAK